MIKFDPAKTFFGAENVTPILYKKDYCTLITEKEKKE